MANYPMPGAEGHYWAKLKTPSGYPEDEADDHRSVNWEVVQVYDNNGEGDERWGVFVPGLAKTQWPLDFVWGPKVPDFNPKHAEQPTREAGPVSGHPSIALKLAAGEWPSWTEIDVIADDHQGDALMEKIIRAAHRGMLQGPEGLRLLYDIRHAMGWNDLTSLNAMPGGIAEMRRVHQDVLDALKLMIAWSEEPDPDSKSVREGQLAIAWSKARAALARAGAR